MCKEIYNFSVPPYEEKVCVHVFSILVACEYECGSEFVESLRSLCDVRSYKFKQVEGKLAL